MIFLYWAQAASSAAITDLITPTTSVWCVDVKSSILTTRGHAAASAARSSQKVRCNAPDKLGILEIGPCDRNQRLPLLSAGSLRAFVRLDRLAGGKLGSDDVDRCIRGVGAAHLSRRNAGNRHRLRNLQ